jgi:hypothetical protein
LNDHRCAATTSFPDRLATVTSALLWNARAAAGGARRRLRAAPARPGDGAAQASWPAPSHRHRRWTWRRGLWRLAGGEPRWRVEQISGPKKREGVTFLTIRSGPFSAPGFRTCQPWRDVEIDSTSCLPSALQSRTAASRDALGAVDESIVNRHIATLEDLDGIISRQCIALAQQQECIRNRTNFHWWPKPIAPS